mmetsp:Transcript_49384/g.56885  ORF Transcript_49384/g.56885 Transcript_49384/m.56885 type:complete len:586 (+) Transcript_49384:23-1780(+)|eukprot:CAMPEP_0176428664 /NCGR_PEP_ID=MMETSP0127-20121128/13277_1 /TAXON_ID=938130 /ORGANISM="Platyophrya macrostoma, Strain WH" /LENGTH=585 /DNA_ID=CAMNT_0017810375 /DNA_START=23 /DNA_END=1780 /DNA_ORIENTATION=-
MNTNNHDFQTPDEENQNYKEKMNQMAGKPVKKLSEKQESANKTPKSMTNLETHEVSPDANMSQFLKIRVEPNDTLEWLSLKHSVSMRDLQELNAISSDVIYPGQVLKIKPLEEATTEEKEIMSAVVLDKKESIYESIEEPSQDLRRKESYAEFEKKFYTSIKLYPVQYCTPQGEVLGTLTITNMCLVFQPNLLILRESASQEDKEYFTQKFTIRVDLFDIVDVNCLTLPNKQYLENGDLLPSQKEYSKDYVVQIFLATIGKAFYNPLYTEALLKLRQDGTAFAIISFRVLSINDQKKLLTNTEKKSIVKEISNVIKTQTAESKKKHEADSLFSKSKIPYVDLMYEKIPEDLRLSLRETYTKMTERALNSIKVQDQDGDDEDLSEHKTIGKHLHSGRKLITRKSFIYVPTMKDKSAILDEDSFLNLIRKVPSLYQICDWKILYSISAHGTSLKQLYRLAKDQAPYLLVIRDSKDNVFGAFIADTIEESGSYYGTGETFLFTFKDNKKEPTCYFWTNNNDYFILTDENGISIGSGGHSGLFIAENLISGKTFTCETFDNEPLVDDLDFTIMKLELWTTDKMEICSAP